MRHEIKLPNYRFPALNTYVGAHWSKGHKLKKQAKLMIMAYGVHVPRAYRKRRVDLHITLTGRQKVTDPDSLWKVALDSLVANMLLVDDSPDYVEMGDVTHERGTETKTVVILTDLPT